MEPLVSAKAAMDPKSKMVITNEARIDVVRRVIRSPLEFKKSLYCEKP
jgi:hypothetical protein